jgi:predicted metal-dependent enzyme (double-stranded beta helix superfamily)
MNRVAANLPARLSSSSEEITMEPDGLQTFIDEVGLVVSSTDDEYEITKRVAERLSDLLAGGYRLPPEVTRPSPVHHVMYPLYIAPDGSWSMASVVWDVGQRTPVHGTRRGASSASTRESNARSGSSSRWRPPRARH